MASKRSRRDITEESQRQSRKQILLARKHAQQTRHIRLALAGVGALLALVFLVAIINEFFIVPNRAVAVVDGENVTLRDWQRRVRYERAQRIILLENQLEAFGGDVGIIQQFYGQVMFELQDAEGLGQNVLNQMVDEVVIRHAAEARGITVTDEEVEQEIAGSFNYFGGESPTPVPAPTETIVPTPSLTPIPTAVITEVVATATPLPSPTIGPASTPLPTPTPVTEEAYRQELGEFMEKFRRLGVDEQILRDVIRMRMYEERLQEVLAVERELPAEAVQASLFLLTFDTEGEAAEAAVQIAGADYVTVWNVIRSRPFDPEDVSTATATELLWRTQEALESSFGEAVAEAAFLLPLNTPSDVLTQAVDEETTRYYIIQVSGRELRPLPEAALQSQQQQLLSNFIDQQLVGNVVISEFWRGRVPTQPVLDPSFLVQPTPAPVIPTPVLIPTQEPVGDEVPEELAPVDEPTPDNGS